MPKNLPKEVDNIIETLEKDGYEAYVVGGCVRDLLLDKKPKDWDITTSATPEEIQKLFPESIYENEFGTVGIKTGSDDSTLALVEATTYRNESYYSDKRHPDKVEFAVSLEQDLRRRDFTINALALKAQNSQLQTHQKYKKNTKKENNLEIIDFFEGVKDLQQGVIRTVGEAQKRFGEDALRMMRAVRLAAELEFTIDTSTFEAIKNNVNYIKLIANERIRDELTKIIDTKNAYNGILFMKDAGLLDIVMPEVARGIGVEQSKHHIYTVFEHNTLALKWAAEHDYPLHVKFAALLHDVAKPHTKQGEGDEATFYGHDVVGGKVAAKLLSRLKFSKDFTERVALLVRHHLFYYEVDEVTESSVRRLVAHVGPENIDDLVKVRIADRMGSGVPKPKPYRLRHFQYMVEKVQKDPISTKMLKVGGEDVMKTLNIKSGPKVGAILYILLDEVLDDPSKNNKKHQLEKIKELGELSDEELEKLHKKAKKKQEEVEKKQVDEIKRKYHVK